MDKEKLVNYNGFHYIILQKFHKLVIIKNNLIFIEDNLNHLEILKWNKLNKEIKQKLLIKYN